MNRHKKGGGDFVDVKKKVSKNAPVFSDFCCFLLLRVKTNDATTDRSKEMK
jgi:hypothetical protein